MIISNVAVIFICEFAFSDLLCHKEKPYRFRKDFDSTVDLSLATSQDACVDAESELNADDERLFCLFYLICIHHLYTLS